MAATQEWRVEHDTMGEVRVPAAAQWQAQTQRAVENFPISGGRCRRRWSTPWPGSRGRWPTENGAAVLDGDGRRHRAAAARSCAGAHDDQFPIDVFQTGSGHATNMNVNEVLADAGGRATRPVRCTPTTT